MFDEVCCFFCVCVFWCCFVLVLFDCFFCDGGG